MESDTEGTPWKKMDDLILIYFVQEMMQSANIWIQISLMHRALLFLLVALLYLE
jgi:hypothetical protein